MNGRMRLGVHARVSHDDGTTARRGSPAVARELCGPILLGVALLLGACEATPPAPSPQGVMDTAADFMPPGSTLQGARRLVVTVDPEKLNRPGGYAGTFTLTNRGPKTVVLSSVETPSRHVTAASPGAMPYRVDPGKSFSVPVRVNLPWERALADGGIARVLTTDGETITLWLQLVSDAPVAPVSAGNPPANPPDTKPRSPQPSGWR